MWTSLGLNQGPPDYEYQLSYKSKRGVVLPGFEPGMTEPKPVVLPLHHSTILIKAFGLELLV